MAEEKPQNFENHIRRDPAYHFFLVPLSVLTFLAAVWYAFRQPGFVAIWLVIMGLLFIVAVFLIRIYSLKVQNRIIRLEETIRLRALLPESRRARIAELTPAQLFALRFASDAELAELAARAMDERLAPADIKKSVRNWRADHFRV